MKQVSPLFTPVLWEGDHFRILDETLLPSRIEYIQASKVSEALEAVREMKTRAFGQVLAFLYAAALVVRGSKGKNPEALRELIMELADEFTQARPTFAFRAVAQFFFDSIRGDPIGQEAGSWMEEKIHEFIALSFDARDRRAKRAAELLPHPCQLLTHCNISGELVVVSQHCRAMGKDLHVIATETRPYLQGSRLTSWEVSRAGIAVSLIPDCAIAQVMEKGEVNAVLVGSDRSAQNGDIVNKVGTYPIALMAKEFGIPFYALVQHFNHVASGEDIPIEERPVSELFTFRGRSLAPDGLEGRYPAFDVTPASLISHLIGFDGAFTPVSFRQRFQKAPPPVSKRKKAEKPLILLYGLPPRDSYAYLSHALKAEQAQGILVPEMRPELLGVHVVAQELLERNMPTTLISDNMMGTFFAKGAVRRLILFYKELGERGPVGVCGSLLAVHLARSHGVPVELLASGVTETSPLDRDISTFMGYVVSPEGVPPYPVEPETIPWSLFKER
ncbi:MAG: S-methyl-5-thioribose-1-phosphate isomerase [Candidatus Binatia bacterium]